MNEEMILMLFNSIEPVLQEKTEAFKQSMKNKGTKIIQISIVNGIESNGIIYEWAVIVGEKSNEANAKFVNKIYDGSDSASLIEIIKSLMNK